MLQISDNGIIYPNGESITDQADLEYFYWGDITIDSDGVLINQGKFSGDKGVYHPYNRFYDAAAPKRVMSAAAAADNTSPWDVTIPVGVTEFHTVYLMIMYDASTSARPTIPGFTTVASRNTTSVNIAATQVLMVGTVLPGQTTITIPNDGTFLGGVAALVALYGKHQLVGNATFVDVANAATTNTGVINRRGRQITIVIGSSDANPTDSAFTPWVMDSDVSDIYMYGPDELGIGGGYGTVTGVVRETISSGVITLSDTDLSPTGGSWYVVFTVERST